MNKIYVFINSGDGTDWIHGMAIAEDSAVLAGHISSSHSFFLHDMGITSDRKHDLYKAHYPDGYELILVDDPKNDPRLKAAMTQKYDSQYDYHDVICPYCKVKTDGSEFEWGDDHLDVECDNCNKVFFAERSFTPSYSTEPSCTLNGGECIPKEHITGGFFRCEICRQSFRAQEENQPPS